MLLLRIATLSRWPPAGVEADPESVARAAVDLTLKGGESGLSVFRVEGARDSAEVALRFALTLRDDPRNVDYLVFPDDLAVSLGLVVIRVPVDDIDPFLSERHHEIIGLDPDTIQRLAVAILSDGRRQIERLPKGELEERGAALCQREPGLRAHIRPGVLKKLPGLRRDSASEG